MLRRIATTAPRRVALSSPSITIPLLRTITTTARAMAPLIPASPPVSRQLPSDGFQLLAEADKAGEAEDALYEQQIKEVEEWWASERYKGIKRPYSAHDIVSKRGSQLQSYPSSVMARKLFNLIKQREAEGKPIHTSKPHPHLQPTLNLRERKLTASSGSHRPNPNDSTGPEPRSPLHLRLGLLRRPHNHQRSLSRLRRLPI